MDVLKVKFSKLFKCIRTFHGNIVCCKKLDFLTGFFNATKLNRNKYFSQLTFLNTSVGKKFIKSIKIILEYLIYNTLYMLLIGF